MPVKDLINGLEDQMSKDVFDVAQGLIYRDFITVGLLLKRLKIKSKTNKENINNITCEPKLPGRRSQDYFGGVCWRRLIPDNWIYIQEKDVKIGRIQIFNNWSPYMVKDKNNVWMGLEYFCSQGDWLWNKPDKEFINFAIDELYKIGFINKEDVLDNVIIRVPKTYPAYFGTYNKFSIIKNFIDKYENLFLIGRNGMHRYNNMDHSMLTAMEAVESILNNIKTKDSIWAVNSEKEYHEEKGIC